MVERKYDSHTFFITVPHWGIEEHNVIKAMARTRPKVYTIKKFDKQGGISTEYDNYAFFQRENAIPYIGDWIGCDLR